MRVFCFFSFGSQGDRSVSCSFFYIQSHLNAAKIQSNVRQGLKKTHLAMVIYLL